MIPLTNWNHVLQTLQLFTTLIFRLRHIRNANEQDEVAMLILIQFQLDILRQYLNLMHFIHHMRTIRYRRRKKKLIKPHFLLQLLHGYRVTFISRNVWNNLKTNWSHFFWLTGETPDTLNDLTNQIQRIFLPYRRTGPETSLDIRNQVSLCSYLDNNNNDLLFSDMYQTNVLLSGSVDFYLVTTLPYNASFEQFIWNNS